MLTALLTEIGKPLQLTDCTWVDLGYGQVLVKILASGICGAQLQEIDGHKTGSPLPHPLGHEGCGIVQEIGPGVKFVKKGDKVVMHWRKGNGIESDFPQLYVAPDRKIITSGLVTTFSQYSVCSENRLTSVPMETPNALCALLGCSLATALGTIENEANLKIGESILIIGCGGLGLNLILASKMRMASWIAAMDKVDEKENSAISMGADVFTLGLKVSLSEFDVVIDTTGSESAIAFGLERLKPSGRFIMVGQPIPGVSVPINNARHLFDGEGCSIKATQGGMFRPSVDIPRYIRAYEAGHLNVDGIVTHRVPLSMINQGIDFVRKGEAGRVLIEP